MGHIQECERVAWSSVVSHCWEDLITTAVLHKAQVLGKFNIVTYLQISRSNEVDTSCEVLG